MDKFILRKYTKKRLKEQLITQYYYIDMTVVLESDRFDQENGDAIRKKLQFYFH